jgi:DnaJ family protein C protein 13
LWSRNDEIPQASVDFALSVLSFGTKFNSNGAFPEASSNANLESAITGSLFILEIVASSK